MAHLRMRSGIPSFERKNLKEADLVVTLKSVVHSFPHD